MSEDTKGWTFGLIPPPSLLPPFYGTIPEDQVRRPIGWIPYLKNIGGKTLIVETSELDGLPTNSVRKGVDEEAFMNRISLLQIYCAEWIIMHVFEGMKKKHCSLCEPITREEWICVFLASIQSAVGGDAAPGYELERLRKFLDAVDGELCSGATQSSSLHRCCYGRHSETKKNKWNVTLVSRPGRHLCTTVAVTTVAASSPPATRPVVVGPCLDWRSSCSTGFTETTKKKWNLRLISFSATLKPLDQTYLETPVLRFDLAYNCGPVRRGKCVIFNNKVFRTYTGLSVRNGTDVDEQSLTACFTQFGFEMQVHKDLSADEIKEELTKLGQNDYTDDDCFVCCILTHGTKNDLLYGCDGNTVTLNEVMTPFHGEKCKSLRYKPKLFFIQACRGEKVEGGVVFDSGKEEDFGFRVPKQANFFVAYSTTPGFVSLRDTTRGSWFVQQLCNDLQNMVSSADIYQILTVVGKNVAALQCYVTKEQPRREMILAKQMPWFISTLTHLVYFSTSTPV